MAFSENDDPIHIAALQHFSYCPRQYALIHLEQEFAENVHTRRGNAAHQRVDDPGVQLERGVRMLRGLPLFSRKYNLIGKADLVEQHPDGRLFPVEYKYGNQRAKKHDHLQVAAQAICLSEMTGQTVQRGAIYHVTAHQRREVQIDDVLTQQVVETVQEIEMVRRSGQLPPAVNDSRCTNCSLKPLCQPEAMTANLQLRSMHKNLFTDTDVGRL